MKHLSLWLKHKVRYTLIPLNVPFEVKFQNNHIYIFSITFKNFKGNSFNNLNRLSSLVLFRSMNEYMTGAERVTIRNSEDNI